jgi:gluconolactonase
LSDWQFEKIAGVTFTEGPVWTGDALLFTDIPNSRIMRYDPATGDCTEHRTGTNQANGLTQDSEGRLYACEAGGRRVARYSDDGVEVVCDSFEGTPLNEPNDVVVDAEGRVWFTDPKYGVSDHERDLDHDSVYRADPQDDGSWAVTRVTFDTTRPNGLIVTPDIKTLYVAQSEYGEGNPRELRAYPIADDGTLGDHEVLHNFYPHRGADGMRLDSDWNIVATAGWETSGPGPMVYVFAPNGRVLETHPIPGRPTNCEFGDADLQTLYVTNADGHLYRARTDRKGLS